MVKQIRASIKIDCQSLLDKPELTCYLGLISSHWAEIEDELATIFAVALQANPAVACALLGRINSTPARLDIIQTTLALSMSEDIAKFFRDNIKDEYRKCATIRSEIIHSHWTTHEDYPDCLIRTKGISDPSLNMFAYQKVDFLKIQHRLLTLQLSLRQFYKSAPANPDSEAKRRAAWTPQSPPEGPKQSSERPAKKTSGSKKPRPASLDR